MSATTPAPPPDDPRGRPSAAWHPPSANGFAIHQAIHQRLLHEMSCALLLIGHDRAAGIAQARAALRAVGWSWPDLLGAPVASYLALRRSYGHADIPSDTLPSRCGAAPPCGVQRDGSWRPGWVTVCAQAIGERVAWAGVPVLAEAALLAAVVCPSPEQVERMDALMRAVWREPAASYPLED